MNTAFDSISIKIASPDQIKDAAKETSCKYRKPADATDGTFNCPEKGTCNCGEVKKAETINYRSFRPEPEGLFCEAIFGPQKDWECNCGKYKRIKHKGVICDRCGVEITQQRVRRDRLGYIQLAAPVSHIWYFKGLPSRIGLFCGLSTRDVERVLYFEGFIVVEVDDPEPQYQTRKVSVHGIDGSSVPGINGSIERYKVFEVPQFKAPVEKYKVSEDIPHFTADKYHFHSKSEKAVHDVLSDVGYEVVPQVKVDTPNSFTGPIDLAISTGKHGEYCLGIEFDGPNHDEPDQKIKDIEKQEELEKLGWRIHRIYYKDWYTKREETEKKLLETVENAKKEMSVPPMLGRLYSEAEWTDFYSSCPEVDPQFAWHITETPSEGVLKVGQLLSDEEYQSYQDVLSKNGVLTEAEKTKLEHVLPDLNVESIRYVTEVFDSKVRLQVGDELSEEEYQQALKKYPPKQDEFTEAELKKRGLSELERKPVLRRITKVSDALEDCDLQVGDELSNDDYEQALEKYQVWRITEVSSELQRCPLKVGTELSKTEYEQAHKQYQIEREEEIPVDKPPVEVGQVLTEVEYADLSNKHWGQFRAGTGAEVIREILSNIDLDEKIKELTQELEETTSQQKRLKTSKQLKQMADFVEAEQRPEWMILDVIPVIPPDLRPLVPLEGGRFATSDLNDLYRRVINRNNRLRKLIQLRSPEVILRNEKRMLQEAVDAFFDNGRHGRRVTGPGNRPLKSLAEVLKGKIGRFRQNLLGKRVDYSGRSVIVVGPELGLHQCGIPKQMAVELFKPFIIERLQAYGYTQTIKRAKHIAEHVDSDSPVWEVVEEVIADHPVLLNRPPTLHRLGIQAFLPVLVEGKSIRIPPLVCKAFNADFDGDQMAVHVPLTVEAQAEAKLLMLSSHNILKPSHGDPIAVPELDMVLGPSFLTKTLPEYAEDAALLHKAYTTSDTSLFEEIRQKPWHHRRYSHTEDVITAHVAGQLKLHDSIQLFCKSNGHTANGGATEPILTTVGRVIFNEVLPPELEWEDEHSEQHIPFYNAEAGGRALSTLIHRCFNELGTGATVEVLENVQKLAFEYATLSGVSPGIKDYITPDNRDALVNEAKSKIASLLEAAETTDREEHENEQIRIWFDAMAQIEKQMFETLPDLADTPLVERGDPRKVHPEVDRDGKEIADKTMKGFSPVHIMADSGARARKNPFMQISAFIGLKAKQDGNILIPPIGTSTDNEYFSSYREGLDVLDYFNSTYGSRKGLVDTALKTASSGYLTRRLVDVAQDVRVTMEDCGTLNSIQKFATAGGDLTFKISGRTTAQDIRHPENGDVLVPAHEVISAQMAEQIDKLDIQIVNVRSVLTCQAGDGVCAKCYGNDLTTNNLVNVGEAVGIIAAQSIGEPGTQLTMRTFHTGGAVEEVSEARQHRILSKAAGTIRFRDFQLGQTVKKEGDLWIVLENRTNLDGPAYKVQQVNHPECQLREGELLSEKQYSENAERYKGFDTKAWQYEVTDVLDSNCKLKVGQQLSQAEYNKNLVVYGFQRFVTPKYRVTEVQHPKISVAVGDLLTEEEAEQKKEEIRQGFDGEWHYADAAMDAILVSDGESTIAINNTGQETKDDAETDRDVDFRSERVYRITEKTDKAFPYQVGEEISTEDITPWLTPFEVEIKPVYVVHTDVNDFSVEQVLTAREFEDARQQYQLLERAFKVEKHDVERHIVTTVHHSECPLKPGEEITKEALDRAHKRFSGFDAQKLRHRVTQVYHPDCTLKPGDLISESEGKKYQERYQGFTTSTQEDTLGGFEAERMYRITAVNHEDCPLKVGDVITQHETTAKRRQYKGIEVSRHYEITNVEDGTTTVTVGQTLTESEYKALQKTDKTLRDKVVSRYNVVSVHHPELQQELEVGTELTDKDYKTYNRKFKGFDTELVYRVVEDKREIENPLEPGTELLSKEYRALEKANQRITHTVTAVYHSNCKYAVGDELSNQEYNNAQMQFPGFEVDELDLQMRIEVETDDSTRIPHVIPADYSFSLAEGDTVRKGEALAELHERTANLDIVAGIPRVTDLFEARRLKRGDAAQIAEIEGFVRSAGTKNGIPTYRIEHEGYESRLYQIPDEKRLIAEGDWVDAGEQLTNGFLNPHDILSIGRVTIEGIPIEGEEAVWAYLVDEVQKVYGKSIINDKHVEVIVRQMLTKVRITDPGDTHFYPNDEVHRKEFQRVNSEILEKDGAPATGEPILQSISKASLSTDSFISAASFQQTTKVLTDAAVSGQTDKLFGLKENVILGRLIPAGSGFSEFQNLEVTGEDEPDEVSKNGEESASEADEPNTPETSPTDIADALFPSDDE